MAKDKLPFEELYESTEVNPDFPKYTTQLLNLANQNAQGTRSDVVGQMSDLIEESDASSFEEWKEWYLSRYPDAIDKATERVQEHVGNLKEAIEQIDEDMVREWVRDLVLVKTAEGLLIEQKIFEHLSQQFDLPHRDSTAAEESKGIDGYIGDTAVTVKPESYDSKTSTKHESLDAAMVQYKKTSKYLTIFYDESDFT
jgi:hypothetical protein